MNDVTLRVTQRNDVEEKKTGNLQLYKNFIIRLAKNEQVRFYLKTMVEIEIKEIRREIESDVRMKILV